MFSQPVLLRQFPTVVHTQVRGSQQPHRPFQTFELAAYVCPARKSEAPQAVTVRQRGSEKTSKSVY